MNRPVDFHLCETEFGTIIRMEADDIEFYRDTRMEKESLIGLKSGRSFLVKHSFEEVVNILSNSNSRQTAGFNSNGKKPNEVKVI